MTERNPQKTATPDPKKDFASPEILIADKKLSAAEKRKLLEQWKQDLMLEMTATQENMPVQEQPGKPAPSSGKNAELLQRVADCLRKVSEGEHAEANRTSRTATGGRR